MNRHLVAHNRFLAEVYPDEKPCESILYLDVETRSEADLKKVGAWEYAAHPSTEIMNASFAVDDTLIQRWLETDDMVITEAIPELSDPTVLLCFHNAEFETAIFTEVCGLTIPTHRILDSAAVARHANLPGALEPLGAFFGFDKDMDGNRIMLKLSKPRRPSKANPDRFWRPETKPEDFEKTYEYCDRDVEVSRHAMNNMPEMSVFESQVYAATFDMNRCGVAIDRDSAQRMHATAEKEKDRLSKEIERDFGFTLGQVSQIADYLGIDSVAKAPLRDLLKDPFMPEDQRRMAEARQTFAKTSLNKLPKFLSRSKTDGRARGNLIYGGAERTARWSGSGIQMQNLTRGIGELQDTAFSALESGLFEYLYDDEIIDILSGMLRGLIQEKNGIFVGDYAQIEARMLAWLAGDDDLLDQFRRGLDPYKIMAAKIYHKAVEDITPDERFMGKQCLESTCLVLTNTRGWIPITQVSRKDKLWDGVEWVSHQGVLYSGMKPTIRRHGVGATSDHRIFLRKKDGSWRTQEWSSVQSNPQDLKLAIQSATLPLLDMKNTTPKGNTLGGDLCVNVSVETSKYSHSTLLADVKCRSAVDVVDTNMLPPNVKHIPHTQTSYSIKETGLGFSTGYQTSYQDVKTQTPKTIDIMAGGELGVISKTDDLSLNTLPLSKDGMTHPLNSTEKTMKVTTKGETCVSSQNNKTTRTEDLYQNSRSKSQNCVPVYDIANAGPRHRFTILTDLGPMIVANCILGSGYGLGYRGFMTMLDQTYDVQIEVTEAKSVTEAYRKNAPKIVSLWKRLERGMLAARSQIGKIVKVNDKIGITFPKLDEMHIILPSKRRLRYYQVKLDIKENGFTSWTCFGKQKTGAGYGRVSIYGGAITGHITQSSARDVMASAIVRLWRRGYPLILTVHDEIVSLAHGPFQAFSDHMEVTPDWLTDFPLKVDAFETIRYKK